jgi:ribosomal protein S18 acetylase RimI-like enzyme
MDRTWRIRRVRADEPELVLAADVFDGPAARQGTMAFLGSPGAEDPRNILMIAEQGGTVVGFASGTILDHPDKPRTLFVQELGVNEPAQRQGIARALIATLRAEGRAAGCRSTWVLTETTNGPARALYAGAGGDETTGVVMFDWDDPEP